MVARGDERARPQHTRVYLIRSRGCPRAVFPSAKAPSPRRARAPSPESRVCRLPSLPSDLHYEGDHMFHRPFISRVSLLIPVLLGAAMPAHAQRPASWFVPNVVEQFNALTDRADPLGFHIADSPDPSTCKHYQGLARLEGPDGTPYLIVTPAATHPTFPVPMIPSATIRPARRGTATSSSSAWVRGIPTASGFAAIGRRRATASTLRRPIRAIASPPGSSSRPAWVSPTTAIPAECRPPATCSRSPSSTPTCRASRRRSCCSSI